MYELTESRGTTREPNTRMLSGDSIIFLRGINTLDHNTAIGIYTWNSSYYSR